MPSLTSFGDINCPYLIKNDYTKKTDEPINCLCKVKKEMDSMWYGIYCNIGKSYLRRQLDKDNHEHCKFYEKGLSKSMIPVNEEEIKKIKITCNHCSFILNTKVKGKRAKSLDPFDEILGGGVNLHEECPQCYKDTTITIDGENIDDSQGD